MASCFLSKGLCQTPNNATGDHHEIKECTDILTEINTYILTKTEIEFLEKIVGYLQKNGEITNYHAQVLTNRPAESVKKLLTKLTELKILTAIGENKGRKYIIHRAEAD